MADGIGIGTCGHVVSASESPICLKGIDRTGRQFLDYVVFCRECRIRAGKARRILHSNEEKEAWIRNSASAKGSVEWLNTN